MAGKWTFRMVVLAAALLTQVVTYATHIIGGEIYYNYLGNDAYEVTLTLYRDCSGASFDANGRITIFTGSGMQVGLPVTIPIPGTSFVPVELASPCLTLPPDLCIETVSYVTVIELPPSPDGYHLTFQRCCRQGDIVNLMNPGGVGITCTIRIPPEEMGTNSSARFNDLPPIALCLNEPLEFDHSASEPDGDDLVYSLITPLAGGNLGNAYPNPAAPPPYNPVAWADGYSEEFQIDSEPIMSIDPNTGLLTVHPTVVGNFVCGVSVKEYRDGVLLSETIRDFLFSVVPCDATVIAALTPQTQFCQGELELTVTNNSIGGQFFSWDFGVPGTDADTSNLAHPTWTYDEFGTYTITLIVNPGAICADTASVTYALYPEPQPYFEVPLTACGPLDTILIAQGMTLENSTIAWYLGWATPSFATTPQVSVTFPDIGEQLVTLTITENGCTGAFDAYVTALAHPSAYFVSDPDSPQPDGANVLFNDLSDGVAGNISGYVWSLNGTIVNEGDPFWAWEDAPPGTHEITLMVITDDGCMDTYTMIFEIRPESIDIPNVFTPNGDGQNDTFVIENVQYYENTLTIYNRWGNTIYEARNYKNQWRAPDVPDGTYFYVLVLGDGSQYTGHLTVLR